MDYKTFKQNSNPTQVCDQGIMEPERVVTQVSRLGAVCYLVYHLSCFEKIKKTSIRRKKAEAKQ